MPSAVSWLEGLSPWPKEFGLDRMHALLERLGHPQRDFPSVHVVGTNGKSTTTAMTAELLRAEGLRVGRYLSPHIRGWHERLGVDAGTLERALDRVRPAAEETGATQFEVLTAAPLTQYAADGVDAAVVEAGLGGRLDATNVLDSRVVVLTNIALEHTEWLGETREAIAAEKLAVVKRGATVILGEREWEGIAVANGAELVLAPGGSNLALARTAAEQFLGYPVDPGPAEEVRLPGRLEHVGGDPEEIWDGAHNLHGLGYVLPRLPRGDYVVLASILADKNVDDMLGALAAVGDTFVATASSNSRALPEKELAARAEPYFEHVEAIADPTEARRRARELAGPAGRVLVTGSLYLLSDLAQRLDT